MVKFKKILLIIGVFYLVIVGGYYLLQDKFFFLPEKLENDFQFDFERPFEEGFFENTEKFKINFLHFKVENPKGNIIYFHGNADNLVRWGKEASMLCEYGYDVWLMDYETFGKSNGKISEEAFYSDAETFYELVTTKTKDTQIILFGRSLGCTFATYLASKNETELLVLEAPFYSLVDALKQRFPFLPHKKISNYTFPSFQFAENVKCPVVVFHGTEDNTIPIEQGKKLFELFQNPEKEFIILEGAGHKDLPKFPKYKETLIRQL